ncbi:MAG: VTT domain-containing protein [bacterium]
MTGEKPQVPPGTQTFLRSLVLVGVLVFSIVIIRYTPLAHALRLSEAPKWRAWLLNYGPWSHAVFLVAGTGILLAGLPRTALASIGGAVFGPFLGTIWTTVATMVAGIASFAFARWIAGDIVLRRLERHPRLDRQFRENGFLVVLLIRLCPVGHNQLTNLFCGTSPVPMRDFIWGSLLGLFPETAAFALLGGSLIGHPWFRLTLGAGLLVALSAGFIWLYRSSRLVADVTKELSRSGSGQKKVDPTTSDQSQNTQKGPERKGRFVLRRNVIVAISLVGASVIVFCLLNRGISGPLARYPYIESVTTDSAAISWATDDPGVGAVQWSTPGGRTEVIETPSSNRLHTVRLTGLMPETVYTYEVLLDRRPITDEYSFKTAPSRYDVPVRFFVLGDSGTGDRPQYAVAKQIERLVEDGRVDFGLHTGDVIYGKWPDDSDQNERYFLPYRSILPCLPLWLSLGNHDVKPGVLDEILNLHELPGNERWYSFDYGPAHVVVLDSSLADSEEQRSWLERDLSGNTDYPWIFAVYHHPPYAWPYADRDDLSQGSDHRVREAWSPILERYGVDMVFNGHSHSYQRTRLIKDYVPDGEGLYYIVTGGGGGRLHSIAEERVEPGLISKYAAETYHFVLVTIQGERLTLEAIDRQGRVFDRFSFTGASLSVRGQPAQ